MAPAPDGRTQSRSQQPLRRSGPIRREARSSRGHCPCARSWRSAACAHRDIAPTDPDPPLFANAAQSASEVNALAKQLHASGLLKRGWDPSKHPRWPAGSLDSVGGRFAPADETLGAAPGYESSASTRTAQALPIPFEAVTPRGAIPWPSEIVPPLGIYPRRELVNPYPDDPECEQEWTSALLHCWKLKERKQLGRGDNRGSGRTFDQCVRGRVSERCGGNPTA